MSEERDFMLHVYARCGRDLDLEVRGDDVAVALGLTLAQTSDLVARLIRVGHLRDAGPGNLVKITIRGIAFAEAD